MSNLIFLLGPTCSGKTQISLELAHSLPNCCVVNCDSRQVYKDFDIISAKVKGFWQEDVFFVDFENLLIPHFLIDFVEFGNFGILDYLEAFENLNLEKFENILVVGGTGYFAKSLLEFVTGNYLVFRAQNQQEFENSKQNLSLLNLQELQKLCPNLKELNQSDSQNPIRLINKILRQETTQIKQKSRHSFAQIYQFLIDKKLEELPLLETIKARFEQGLLEETQKMQQKYTAQKLLQFGLEYKNLLVQKPLNELIFQSYLLNRQYAKRQITWFKKQNLVPIADYKEILEIILANF